MQRFTILFSAFFALVLLSFAAFSQNRFEGYNIILDVPENQQTQTCTIRYVPPTTNITVSDLDTKTPMNLRSCSGSGASLRQNGSTASMTASKTDYKWCFEGEDKSYRISFRGDQSSGTVIYDWIPNRQPNDNGAYNIKDFGAKGDGRTDDTISIQSALAYLATRNGGTLVFPEGDYMVGGTSDFKGLVVPSGVTIQGTVGVTSNSFTNNVTKRSPTRIVLTGINRALFKIGECTEDVSIKDIELYAQNNNNTYGFEGVGAFTSSQNFFFERVVFNNFFRGIYGHGLPVTSKAWQFDYIKIQNCRFIYNRDAGVYSDVSNSDWKIEGSLFINPKKQAGQNANSMHFERSAAVLISDTFGGGFPSALGGTFLNILAPGMVTVIASQTENMTNSIYLNEANIQGAGDYSFPLTVINSTFGNQIVLNARINYVSTGSSYGPGTFKADPLVRIYSTGDRFCYDGGILGCQGATRNLFDKATVMFMTGQPSDFGRLEGYPTIFGTDVQFNAPVQMPTFDQNRLPVGKPDGSMVYCKNCKRNSTPCQQGGNGAPAMLVAGQWSCL
ncbi:MAG TPA: glycosyl hydrolase family 28-related protein [Pyrinomonadaceae bacterium]|nr:glycosyl hydrolase family 28-related protein [Pyrinomonadaceae bacterium]